MAADQVSGYERDNKRKAMGWRVKRKANGCRFAKKSGAIERLSCVNNSDSLQVRDEPFYPFRRSED